MADTLPPCGQTHTCKNITLATTSLRPVKIVKSKITLMFHREFEKCCHSNKPWVSVGSVFKDAAEKGVAELIGCLQGTSQRINRTFLNPCTRGEF